MTEVDYSEKTRILIFMSAKIKKEFRVEITPDECKGCGRCVYSCPVKVLEPTGKVNSMGIVYIAYKGSGCIGCGSCFYACPEPGAITVFEKEKDKGDE